MGEDLVGLVEAMTHRVAVNLRELCSGFVAVEKAEDSPLRLKASFAHGFALSFRAFGNGSVIMTVRLRE